MLVATLEGHSVGSGMQGKLQPAASLALSSSWHAGLLDEAFASACISASPPARLLKPCRAQQLESPAHCCCCCLKLAPSRCSCCGAMLAGSSVLDAWYPGRDNTRHYAIHTWHLRWRNQTHTRAITSVPQDKVRMHRAATHCWHDQGSGPASATARLH